MILFRHAQIYDGTGQKPFLGDVLVRNDRIAEVGQNLEVPEDTEILEADGSRKRRDEAVRRRDRHPFPLRGRHERAAGQPAHRDRSDF